MTATIPFFQVDAFASQPFEGNQACVMPLDAFLPDDVLQAIAAENNVAETAFIVPVGEGRWQLRWFTPAVEVPLCGHATLASGHVIYEHLGYSGDQIVFETRQSGDLFVSRGTAGLVMDFPASPLQQVEVTADMEVALGACPMEAWAGSFLACVFETAGDILALDPDHRALAELGQDAAGWDRGNVGCVAPGGPDGADIVSRFFAPGSGIDEDPATGSWHCMAAPLMGEKLGRSRLSCFQAYPGRGAWVGTEIVGDRVNLSGTSVTIIEGQFRL
ncbi:MAG: PhzF family phenazine biosynthesis protein [Pseudomonadota bacterium]